MRHTAPVIVHLLAPDTPDGKLRILAALLARPSLAATQLVFRLAGAPSHDGHSCTGFGSLASLRRIRPVHAILPHRWFKAHALRHELHKRGLFRIDRTVILHAWSPAAADWCRPLSAGNRPVLVDVELGTDLRRMADWSATPSVGYACPSTTAQQRLLALGIPAPRIVVVRPGLDFATLHNSHRGPVRARLTLDGRDVVVLALPPITRWAGTLTVAWAALLLEKVQPAVRLMLPPDGRELRRVRRLVEACRHERVVRFAPPDLTLTDLLAATDVAVYLPHGDAPTFSLACAMAAARPIVSTRVPAITELLGHGEDARLCRPNDPEDTVRAMLAMLENTAESGQQAQRARQQAEVLFVESQMIERYARAYVNLVARRPAGAAAADTTTLS